MLVEFPDGPGAGPHAVGLARLVQSTPRTSDRGLTIAVIAALNEHDRIGQAIRSLDEQSSPPDITIVCVGLLAFIRDFDRDLLLVLLGAACYAAGDLLTIHSSLVDPGNWPWPGAVLWCLSWPLIAAGLLRYEPKAILPADRESAMIDPDARGVAITTTVSLAMLLTSLGFLQRIFDTASLTFTQWCICTGIAASIVVVEELIKLVIRLRASGGPAISPPPVLPVTPSIA